MQINHFVAYHPPGIVIFSVYSVFVISCGGYISAFQLFNLKINIVIIFQFIGPRPVIDASVAILD